MLDPVDVHPKVDVVAGGFEEHEAAAGLRETTMANVEQLFTLTSKAQRQAVRSNSRERVRRTLNRYKNAFRRDHPTSALRRDAESLLEDIESQLIEVNEETEQVRASIRMTRSDFKLAEESGAGIDDYENFSLALRLSHAGACRPSKRPPMCNIYGTLPH